MKISHNWLSDFLPESFKNIAIEKIISEFNTKVAEIENFTIFSPDISNFYIAKVTKIIKNQTIILFCAELNLEINCEFRSCTINQYFFIKKNAINKFEFCSLSDFGVEKNSLLEAIYIAEKTEAGDWRTNYNFKDIIISVDNKSINHRPDLWSHYGIARELSVIFDLKLKPINEFCDNEKIETAAFIFKGNNEFQPISIKINAPKLCSRFAGVFCKTVIYKDSELQMALRLLAVSAKPINCIVDITNYVMLEFGHPMHVFDSNKIANQQLEIRTAKENEKLLLLDLQEIILDSNNLVVADSENPLALAGIMGGKNSSYTNSTNSIFIEAAVFDAANIRKTTAQIKLRTEASVRFEKVVAADGNLIALKRFLNLAKKLNCIKAEALKIIDCGEKIQQQTLSISKKYIEKKLGIKLNSHFIKNSLEKLGFEVIQNSQSNYNLTIPNFRFQKELAIQDDIVEELGRIFGYDKIKYTAPKISIKHFNTDSILKLRRIKDCLAFACNMTEVRNYAFFDTKFLAEIKWVPKDFVAVKNPVSENYSKLATSLIPNLLKNISQNFATEESLNFFECNNTWKVETNENKKITETNKLAGIFWSKAEQKIDFYLCKEKLAALWNLAQLNPIYSTAQKISNFKFESWNEQKQTGAIFLENEYIGSAGMCDKNFTQNIFPGSAFVFEFDINKILHFFKTNFEFKSYSKYPIVEKDIACFVSLEIEAATLENAILNSDKLIKKVELLDFYKKTDWTKKSLCFRYYISSDIKTLTKIEIEAVSNAVITSIKKYCLEIR